MTFRYLGGPPGKKQSKDPGEEALISKLLHCIGTFAHKLPNETCVEMFAA
jgi:hypothetical protein